MPSITFGGMASGLPPNLVDQLIEVERMPIKKMEETRSKSEDRLKLVTDLEEKMRNLQGSVGTLATAKGFNDIKLMSGDPNVVQGTVDPAVSVSGSWNIEVKELAQKAAAITNGFPDKDRTEIGVGYFKFETPDGSKQVLINGTNNTLEGAAAAINAANVGMRATVLNDRSDPDYPYKLMVSGESVGGDANVEYPKLYFLDGDQDLYFDEERAAKNGRVVVDGFEFEIASNTVENVIPGVTLELKQASPGRSVNVTVKEDQEVVSGKVDEFVKALNGVLGFIQAQNKLDKSTDTSRTLGGDSLIRSLEGRIQRLIQTPQYGVSGSINRLNQLGITFNRGGTVSFDQEKFNAVLAKDPVSVQMFFAGDGFNTGFIPNLNREVKTVLDSAFGPLALRRQALQQKIDRINQNIDNKEKQLVRKEDQLRKKFAKLEESMSKLKQQGASLAAVGAGGGISLGAPSMRSDG